jgi:predicted O-methyltransferase YrrM
MTNFPEDLRREILSSVAPDGWNHGWSQVERFGGQMAVELEVGELLHALVRAVKPMKTFETGTHRGFSTLMIASALRANRRGHLFTVDIKDYGVAQECQKFGLQDWVTIIHDDSAMALRRAAAESSPIDFLWLDADHGTEFVLKEIDAALPALRPGSLVAFHDTLTDAREMEAVRTIAGMHPQWQRLHFVTARGFDLMRVM